MVVDENREDCALITLVISKELPGLEIVPIVDEDTFFEALAKPSFVAVITEFRLSWTDGFHVLNAVRSVLSGVTLADLVTSEAAMGRRLEAAASAERRIG